VRFPEFFVLQPLATTRCQKHCTGKLCLDNAFVLIEGHPPQQLRLRFGDEDAPLRQFWQRRFHDFNVWSARKCREKLEYMHANPVKRKLVAHPKEWEWSSFSFYSSLKRGLIRVDPVH